MTVSRIAHAVVTGYNRNNMLARRYYGSHVRSSLLERGIAENSNATRLRIKNGGGANPREARRFYRKACSRTVAVPDASAPAEQLHVQQGRDGSGGRPGAELGQTFAREHRRGTSDANFFGSFGVPTVDGLGPVCKDYHTPEEFVFVSSIKERSALLAMAVVSKGRHFAGNG